MSLYGRTLDYPWKKEESIITNGVNFKVMEEEKDCWDCKHVLDSQDGIGRVCYYWCPHTGRDFTFGKADTTACELFEPEE